MVLDGRGCSHGYPCELALDDGEDELCELLDTDLLDDELDRLTSTVLDDDSLDADFDELLDVEPLDGVLPDDVLLLDVDEVTVCVDVELVLAVEAEDTDADDLEDVELLDQDASAVLLDESDELDSSKSSTHHTRKPQISGLGACGGVTTAGNSHVATADTCESSAMS